MKKYYASDDAVATVVVTGGKLTAEESKSVRGVFAGFGLKEVTRAKYLTVQATLPPTKKHIKVSVGDDGEVETTEE